MFKKKVEAVKGLFIGKGPQFTGNLCLLVHAIICHFFPSKYQCSLPLTDFPFIPAYSVRYLRARGEE